MAIQIKFDTNHNPLKPTIVLIKRNGHKIGILPAENIHVRDAMNDASEISFSMTKITGDASEKFWDELRDFRLVWVKEWNRVFEIYVEINESNSSIKNVTGTSLGKAELSQTMLYDVQINTEDDIARDDYKPSVIYDEDDPSASILNRILEKAPHYTIRYVSPSLRNIQRTFEFDNESIDDALNDIATEIECLFVYDCHMLEDGTISRDISVYDLLPYCAQCLTRGVDSDTCPNCGSTAIDLGYGEDTNIFVSKDNLAESITFTTDVGAVKNCFRLEAGDDLMTAVIRSINPNGNSYIYYFTDEEKEDMSDGLRNAINVYQNNMDTFLPTEYTFDGFPSDLKTQYNDLIDKYSSYTQDYERLTSIVGYKDLIETYYNVVDFGLYLESGLMPSPDTTEKTASYEANKINTEFGQAGFTVAVSNIETCTKATADATIVSVAKIVLDSGFKVEINSSEYNTDTKVWSGTLTVTNYSNSEDVANTSLITTTLSGDYETFVKQKIDIAVKNKSDDSVYDIVDLLHLDYYTPEEGQSESPFVLELQKYSLNRLLSIQNACNTSLEIMISQGVSNPNKNPELYEQMYFPYYGKSQAISNEIAIRQNEISVITCVRDRDGRVVSDGVQTIIEKEDARIQSEYGLENTFTEAEMLELSAFRREDTYTNDNYISDGLSNAELIESAYEFLEEAKKELYKSATLQHSIQSSLSNLLVMREFESLVDNFAVGNYIRVRVDNEVYRLRLVSYEVDYDSIGQISVEFSDMTIVASGVSDVEDILNRATSMATTYDSVARQASKGKDGNDMLDNWVERGLALTKMKIINDADNQDVTFDDHGIQLQEYLPITDDYDDKKLKIINRGLYVTKDNWETSSAGIGDFTFYNPITQTIEDGYGVIADTLVGNLILSENVGVYNTNNSITLNRHGLTITTNETDDDSESAPVNTITIQKKIAIEDDEGQITGYDYVPQMTVNENGDLILSGSILIGGNDTTLDQIVNMSADLESAKSELQDYANSAIEEAFNEAQANLESYKDEIGQYMKFDEDGLEIGAQSSPFKTEITNTGVYFTYNGASVSYVQNDGLNIPDAIINRTLRLGSYVFKPHSYDEGMSLVWDA